MQPPRADNGWRRPRSARDERDHRGVAALRPHPARFQRPARHARGADGGGLMSSRVTLPSLTAKKAVGDKIVAIVAWDYQMARIADTVGADIVVVGDSVGVNLWGHATPFELTIEQLLVV